MLASTSITLENLQASSPGGFLAFAFLVLLNGVNTILQRSLLLPDLRH
jgi:hypothetical protein